MKSLPERKKSQAEVELWQRFYRLRARAQRWTRRSLQGWKDFRGGTAWVILYSGVPAKVKVLRHGLLDEWPYHLAFCDVISMDASASVTVRRGEKSVSWKLINRAGKTITAHRGPRSDTRMDRCENIKRRAA